MTKEYRVVIPDAKYRIIEFVQEDFPGVGFINFSFQDFEPKAVFAWHLSIMINLEDMIENGMPSKEERKVIDEFESRLDLLLKGPDVDKPNALFLARITWNETRELMWRIYNPETANQILQTIIDQNDSPREFDYRMDSDEEWRLTEWVLKDHKNQSSPEN
jgi:hypothetical protein